MENTRVNEARVEKGRPADKLSVIIGIIKEQCRYSASYRSEWDLLLKRVISRGFNQADLRDVVEQYSMLGVLMEEPDGAVRLLDRD